MTEENDDGNNLVRVRAQVMTRDDSTGGWVPMGGGGLSNVSVRKRILQTTERDDVKPEYFIYGKRISDQAVVLSCTIKKDFQYNKVMPTFHHWVTGDHKFGLTFQTAADARAFDKGVRLAVDDILEGFHEFPSKRFAVFHPADVADDGEVFMAVDLPIDRDGSRSSSGSATTCSSGSRRTPNSSTPLPATEHTSSTEIPLHHFHHLHHHLHHHHHHVPGGSGGATPVGGGGGVISTTNTSPSSTLSTPAIISSSTTNPPFPYNHHYHHLHRMTYLPRHSKPLPAASTPISDKGFPSECEKGDYDKIQVFGDSYSYVQFAKSQPLPPNHDYSYPMVPETYKGERRDSIASLKKQHQTLELVSQSVTQPLSPSFLPGKRYRKRDRRNKKMGKLRCRYCQDTFTDEFNSKGSCEFAPDCVRSTIDKLTCIGCAQCMLYHCMSDAEGEYPQHPCECRGESDESCGRKWLGLTLLSLLVPCLWCYLPLKSCHRCGVACGLCGGKHDAS